MNNNNKTRGYDLADIVPKYSTLIYVTLREGLSLKYLIDNQEFKRVYIRETQDKLPKNERSLVGFVLDEIQDPNYPDDPLVEFKTADGFIVQEGLRCSQVIDYKVFCEDKKYSK